MGAVLVDAGLQAGIRYEGGVRPRVANLIAQWPDAVTVAGFRGRMATAGALEDVLSFHGKKLATIKALADRLAAEGVDTLEDFTAWIATSANASSLRTIRGIGPKTVDYLLGLAGLPSVPVDRHLYRFVARGWPTATTYDMVHDLVLQAATCLGEDPGGLEHAIWLYESTSPTRGP